jgi:hypothetical protein
MIIDEQINNKESIVAKYYYIYLDINTAKKIVYIIINRMDR